jgi:hypothetical protein
MNRNGQQAAIEPWRDIAASIVPQAQDCRDHSAAMRSPCESCSTSPCCSFLPLGGFRVATLSDLDYAVYLLNFQRIELGLTPAGDWSVFYRHPCRYLDRSSFACTIHEKVEQPHICRRYNPYRCWYKTALTQSTSSAYLRIDRTRLRSLVTGIRFDAQGNIVESPDWAGLLEVLENVFDGPEDAAAEPAPRTPEPAKREAMPIYSFDQVREPCTGCAAYCCRVLIFPMERPADASGFDYLQFCLGFPGIRIGISDTQWAILVDTECRHLENNRCSIFGLPERPLACRYYDEWRCTYKLHFEQAESAGVLHVDLDQYRHLLGCLEFDCNGAVMQIPKVSELRKFVGAS